MALQEGETYRCPDESCGCEIMVTSGPQMPNGGGDEPPRCCCGRAMELQSSREESPI